jgi:hypothetical protein
MPKSSAANKERKPQDALACGEAFQNLAEEIIAKIGTIKEDPSQDMPPELADVVVCATNLGFAIELYLKALLIHLDLQAPHVHDLRALYDAIPQPVRAIIENVYDAALPDEVRQLHGRVSITLAKGPIEKPRWDDYRVSLGLPDLLRRSRDLFQSWRYIFEFSQHKDSPHQFHQFEYGLLRCAAEAMRVEAISRLAEAGEGPPPTPLTRKL